MLEEAPIEERIRWIDILKEAENRNYGHVESEQIREIVSVENWVDDPFYVGADGMLLYQYWKDFIVSMFSSDTEVFTNEVILTGSLGTGKSTVSLFIMLRKLYELSCYKNINSLFDLMPSSFVTFIYFSISLVQAELTGFGQFRRLVDSIPYFEKHFQRNKDLSSILKFPENILFIYGSDVVHSTGMNVLGTILDEANFFQGEGSTVKAMVPAYSKVSRLYSSLTNRAKSRFAKKGKDSSLSILVSSATHASSFTEKRIKKSKSDPTTKIASANLWEVKPKGTYSSSGFYVFQGSDKLDPFVVNSFQDVNQVLSSEGQKTVPFGLSLDQSFQKVPDFMKPFFVWIPDDFKKTFDTDVVASLQDIAGISVAPLGKLFNSVEVYNKCCSGSLTHPFYKDSFIIATHSRDRVQDYLVKGYIFKEIKYPHFIHIDQSAVNDATGISMCHRVDKIGSDGELNFDIVMDFMVRIDPPRSPYQISVARIREFIFYLRDVLGMNIAVVSYDVFGSLESRQHLSEGGFNEKYLSVDRSDEAYLTLVNLMYESRFISYDYPIFKNELFDLLHDRMKRKVNHPPNGTKDVADSVAGCVFSAVQNVDSSSQQADRVGAFLEINSSHSFEDDFTLEELVGPL